MVERKHFAVGVVLEGRDGKRRQIVEVMREQRGFVSPHVQWEPAETVGKGTPRVCGFATLEQWAVRIVPAPDAAPGLADVLAAELRKVEWGGGGNLYDCIVACPSCGKQRNSFDNDVSHKDGCSLAKALAMAVKGDA